jgi:hypothetical protein
MAEQKHELKWLNHDCCKVCVYVDNNIDCPFDKKLKSYGGGIVSSFVLSNRICTKFERDHING